MWNQFLEGFDAPLELFINLQKDHVDYGEDHQDYEDAAGEDEYWTTDD